MLSYYENELYPLSNGEEKLLETIRVFGVNDFIKNREAIIKICDMRDNYNGYDVVSSVLSRKLGKSIIDEDDVIQVLDSMWDKIGKASIKFFAGFKSPLTLKINKFLFQRNRRMYGMSIWGESNTFWWLKSGNFPKEATIFLKFLIENEVWSDFFRGKNVNKRLSNVIKRFEGSELPKHLFAELLSTLMIKSGRDSNEELLKDIEKFFGFRVEGKRLRTVGRELSRISTIMEIENA